MLHAALRDILTAVMAVVRTCHLETFRRDAADVDFSSPLIYLRIPKCCERYWTRDPRIRAPASVKASFFDSSNLHAALSNLFSVLFYNWSFLRVFFVHNCLEAHPNAFEVNNKGLDLNTTTYLILMLIEEHMELHLYPPIPLQNITGTGNVFVRISKGLYVFCNSSNPKRNLSDLSVPLTTIRRNSYSLHLGK